MTEQRRAGEPDPIRQEAERLVEAAVAALSLAARGIAGSANRPFATGSEECCICPVCRLIAAMRDPSEEMTDRLASGAGDIASAVANALRTLTRTGGGGAGDEDEDGGRPGEQFWDDLRRRATQAARSSAPASRGADGEADEDPWRAATTAPAQPTPMAKKAVAKKAAGRKPVTPRTPPARNEQTEPAGTPRVAPMARKAVKKAVSEESG